MPKKVSTQEVDQVLSLVARYPEGVGIDGLLTPTNTALSRRTLQRRLASLLAENRIQSQGEGRATRYLLPEVNPTQEIAPQHLLESPVSTYKTGEPLISISPEGEAIRAYIRQARQKRTPIGYQTSFLEAYHPNQTAYLPESLRSQLHSMGRSPSEQTPAGTFARDILNRLLIDLSWASSKLEGNTYSWLDTERLIAHGQVADEKDALETQMILNHKAAIEYLVHNSEQADVNPETIIALHALLADGLMTDPLTVGRLRTRPVGIGGSVYLPLGMPQGIEELFGIVLQMAAEIEDPFEQSFFLMVHLPYLQPFEDVNKRVSRLAANIPLIRHNLCPLTFIDVPQQAYVDGLLGIYELNRVELLRDVYVAAYERACQQYVAVRREMIQPDIFRLRHRNELAETIRAIVQGGLITDERTLRQHLPASLSEANRPRFITLVQEEFKALHAGNAVRFGIRPLEFAAWMQRAPQ